MLLDDEAAFLAIHSLSAAELPRKMLRRWRLLYINPSRAGRRQACSLPGSPTKGFNMLDEVYPMTCEDTCDDWFQEPPNDQGSTGESRLGELVQSPEISKTCSTVDATDRWPEILALKLGCNPRQASGRSGPGTTGEWHDGA
jgi:hypothetical protein